ncbi:trimethylamine methyltransferase MttB [Desulfosarcina widdelii]|uniref:Trimethylamine methyltransferase MttB n=1 Tax=Desulfosarcina widdelii TaxID=947919 RepID=A0A5K7ZD39_9BACT|nr:trimethylamine methyltransferase family protein [Desulfosarcina widdelii]BBO78740.1 trimethylamine methyltransferase MttB [Desulfosarcina widdelii]
MKPNLENLDFLRLHQSLDSLLRFWLFSLQTDCKGRYRHAMNPPLSFKPTLQVLNDEQIQELHRATARVLERTGVKVTHPEALEIFAGGGARVETDRVFIPRTMLEDAIQRAPGRIVLGNRKGEEAVVLEDDACWFGATLDNIYYFDPTTSQRRQLTLDDCRYMVSIFDALPNLSWGMTFGAISDVPAHLSDRYAAMQALKYSEKPIVFSSNDVSSLVEIFEMVKVATGNEGCFETAPPAASFVTTISPLVIPDHVVEQLILCAENAIPQICYAGVQAGSTGPMSFAGTIVQGNAETLACLVLSQLVRLGSPVVFGHLSTIMDMRSSIFSFGAPEMNLMIAAQSQIARHYSIPFYGTAGCSDSKLPDAQAAVEAVFSCFSSALGCSGLIHDAGLLEYATMSAPEHMVLVNEVLHMVGQYKNGIDVGPEALALDVIDAIGPGGQYLTSPHTMKHFREVWYSQLFDRSGYSNWLEGGAKDLTARVRERTLALMAQQPAPLDDQTIAALDEMSRQWT